MLIVFPALEGIYVIREVTILRCFRGGRFLLPYIKSTGTATISITTTKGLRLPSKS